MATHKLMYGEFFGGAGFSVTVNNNNYPATGAHDLLPSLMLLEYILFSLVIFQVYQVKQHYSTLEA